MGWSEKTKKMWMPYSRNPNCKGCNRKEGALEKIHKIYKKGMLVYISNFHTDETNKVDPVVFFL